MRILTIAVALAGVSLGPVSGMTLASRDIPPGAKIAAAQIYPECGGRNISPDLAWSGQPEGTRSFVVTMIDLDVAPARWSHWIVVGLPPDVTALPEGVRALPGKARAVTTNFGDAAYGGPCPPKGSGVHHYETTIWAMPTADFEIPPDGTATELESRLLQASLDHASFTATAER